MYYVLITKLPGLIRFCIIANFLLFKHFFEEEEDTVISLEVKAKYVCEKVVNYILHKIISVYNRVVAIICMILLKNFFNKDMS